MITKKLTKVDRDLDDLDEGVYLYQSIPARDYKLDPEDPVHAEIIALVDGGRVEDDPAARARLNALAKKVGLKGHRWDGGMALATDLSLREVNASGGRRWRGKKMDWFVPERRRHG